MESMTISEGVFTRKGAESRARNDVTPLLSALQLDEARLRALLAHRMSASPDAATKQLDDESNTVISALAQLGLANKPNLEANYIPLPVHARLVGATAHAFAWRVELCGLKGDSIGIELLDDVILGRGPEADIDLDPYNAYPLAVSRRHAMLRPSQNHLHLMDLGSTNGTLHNTIPLGRCATYQIKDQDVITLGLLTFTVRIVSSPVAQKSSADVPASFLRDAIRMPAGK